MSDKKSVRIPCRKCRHKTVHDVVCESLDPTDKDYDFVSTYQVVQCRGCLTKAFRHYTADYEQAYPVSDDEWEFPETEEFYPRFSKDHDPIENLLILPDVVSSIYNESMVAVQEGAFILAGLGLRSTIEAVCNNQNIAGSNLASRITKLSQQGLISKKDAERLHGIRFMGNDAAHDIKKPNLDQIRVALKIVDHLINSVYILELEASGKLDTSIDDLASLIDILRKKHKSFNKGDEYPLAKFLDKDTRRLSSSFSSLESQLIAEISAGGFSGLSLGKVDEFANSKTKLQHFVVT